MEGTWKYLKVLTMGGRLENLGHYGVTLLLSGPAEHMYLKSVQTSLFRCPAHPKGTSNRYVPIECTPHRGYRYTSSHSQTAGAGTSFVLLEYSWLLWPLQKCFKNQSFFNFFAFRPHQARTCMHGTCITHEIRRRYIQINLKVTPKCPKSYFHMPKVVPKWHQSDPFCLWCH